jgi:hypothetical protein
MIGRQVLRLSAHSAAGGDHRRGDAVCRVDGFASQGGEAGRSGRRARKRPRSRRDMVLFGAALCGLMQKIL